METLKLYNKYSAFYPASATQNHSKFTTDSSFHFTASEDEEGTLYVLDSIFEREQMIQYLNLIIGGQLDFYHSEYHFIYSNEKVYVNLYYYGQRKLSLQEKVAKGYDIAEDVFSDDTLRLAQTITFKATNVHAGNWSLIIEEEPTIELVEIVNKKSIAPQNEFFGYLSEKYSEENLHNIGKLMELLTVLIKFDVKRGKNKSLALRDGLSFIKRIIPFEYEHKFPIKFSKVGIVEEGENKGKISVIYSEEDMSDIGIYDISLLEDELRLVRDLEHHQSIKIC